MSGSIVTWPDHVCRIEGHGSLKVSFEKDSARLEVLEGERLFEGILLGRSLFEAPFITSRICGICPTAHVIVAYQAAEAALGIEVSDDAAAALRKVLLAAQNVQSHALHAFVLALPDYLGLDSAIEIAEKFPKEFAIALRLKELGDRAIAVIGGRPVHPVSVAIGGFSKLPELGQLEALYKMAGERIVDAEAATELLKGLDYPEFGRATEYFSLRSPKEYATYGNRARIASSKGFDSEIAGYRAKGAIMETVKDYSTAKFGTHNGRGFMVGALARLNLNRRFLHPKARKALANSKIKLENTFHNVLAQGIETVHYIEDMQLNLKWLIDNGVDEALAPKIEWRAGEGAGASEVPRGTLYYYYKVDEKGAIKEADIITPTVQNLTNIEEDANQLLQDTKGRPAAERRKLLEMLVRAYDPCLSCSTH